MTDDRIRQLFHAGMVVLPSAAIDLKVAGLKIKNALRDIVDAAEYWRTPSGAAHASLRIGDRIEHCAVADPRFADWLRVELERRYLDDGHPALAGDSQIRDAINYAKARAARAVAVHAAPLRVGEYHGDIILDRGTPDWSAIVVGAEGHRLVRRSPTPILRSGRTTPYPELAERGDLEPLRRLLGLSLEAFVPIVIWCLAALRPHGPYPILAVIGGAGSGKTTLVRILRQLVDPTAGDLRAPPTTERDLMALARNSHVLVIDNVSEIPPRLSDSLCRLATGGEHGGRALFSDFGETTFCGSRPIILNGIADFVSRDDLLSRAYVVELPSRSEWLAEHELRESIHAALPLAFRSLLDALVMGLRRFRVTPTPPGRLCECERFAVAAEPALLFPQGTVLAALQKNRAEAAAVQGENDIVISAVLEWAQDRRQGWTGTMGELYGDLYNRLPAAARRTADWPKAPNKLSTRIKLAFPTLRGLGVEVSFGQRTGSRRPVTIRSIASPSKPSSRSSSVVASDADQTVNDGCDDTQCPGA
jgi:energy-coupling factor transporter ATP-binding protein EcfA2